MEAHFHTTRETTISGKTSPLGWQEKAWVPTVYLLGLITHLGNTACLSPCHHRVVCRKFEVSSLESFGFAFVLIKEPNDLIRGKSAIRSQARDLGGREKSCWWWISMPSWWERERFKSDFPPTSTHCFPNARGNIAFMKGWVWSHTYRHSTKAGKRNSIRFTSRDYYRCYFCNYLLKSQINNVILYLVPLTILLNHNQTFCFFSSSFFFP
jgi:hypothetical protein